MHVTSWHVGRGADWRGLTVFPVWRPSEGPAVSTVDPGSLRVRELEDGPSVGALEVTNTGSDAILVLEGQLFEGGWQHRMALGTRLLVAGETAEVEVACVEEGRWGGETEQRTAGRRATPYVRRAGDVRADAPWDDSDPIEVEHDVQGQVWQRVESQLTRVGGLNASMSLVSGLDARRDPLEDSEPPPLLPGQTGVVIGVGGQPYLAEVFESPEALAAAYDALLASALPEAATAPAEPTPARRVQRFLRRAEQVHVERHRSRGEGLSGTGSAHDVDVRVTYWRDRVLHGTLTNLRHPILLGA